MNYTNLSFAAGVSELHFPRASFVFVFKLQRLSSGSSEAPSDFCVLSDYLCSIWCYVKNFFN